MVDATIRVVDNASRWNFRQLAAALAIGSLLQGIILPCLCEIGTAKIGLALSFDGLILIRMLLAYMRGETGRGWVFYVVLCYTSAVWIEGVTFLVLGDS